jgi:hypothetical protein
VEVSEGQEVLVRVKPGGGGRAFSLINGLQVVKLNDATSPPVIYTQPHSQQVPENGVLQLSVSAGGAQPLIYQWRFGTNDIPAATNATLQISPFHASSTGTYTVLITNQLGSRISEPAIVSLGTVRLLNIDFGDINNTAFYQKVGVAAIGLGHQDFWNNNNYQQATTALRWSDGSAAGITLSGGTSGLWFTYNTDAMFESYMYGSGEFRFQLAGTPPGNYDLYVYAHGQPTNEIGSIEAIVGDLSLGTKGTGSTGSWNSKDWTEGLHYVVFRNISIQAGTNLQIVTRGSPAVLNGMQLITASPNLPAGIAQGPASQTVVDGQSLLLEQKSIGPGPISYQWLKDSQPIEGATGASLLIPAVAPTDAGLYQVRAVNAFGADLSDSASIRVIAPTEGKLLNVDFEVTGHPLEKGIRRRWEIRGRFLEYVWREHCVRIAQME